MSTSVNTKLEVAIEILAAKIAKQYNQGYTIKDDAMKILLKEREEMYIGNENVIEKIIKGYGPEVKSNYEGVIE